MNEEGIVISIVVVDTSRLPTDVSPHRPVVITPFVASQTLAVLPESLLLTVYIGA